MNDYREASELYHFGILGQKWGIRRYQNPDGSLTPEGKKRYGIEREEYNAQRGDTVRKGTEYRISGQGKDKKTVDKLAKAGDMKKADEIFKSVGDKAMAEFYKSGDVNKAMGILIEGMKDVPFDYVLDHEKNLLTGEEWVGYKLTSKGKNFTIDSGDTMYKPSARIANQHAEQAARDAAQAHQDSMRMAQQAHEDAIRAAEIGRQQAEQAVQIHEQMNQIDQQQQQLAQQVVQQEIIQQQMMFMMM